jgi:hypothetical protein
MLAHVQVIVGTPDGDRLAAAIRIGGAIQAGLGICAAFTQDVGEDPVPAFALQGSQGILETGFVGKRHELCSQGSFEMALVPRPYPRTSP